MRWRSLRALNEGRSLNPGDTSVVARRVGRSTPLNEGRSLNPGDTLPDVVKGLHDLARSTKAGV